MPGLLNLIFGRRKAARESARAHCTVGLAHGVVEARWKRAARLRKTSQADSGSFPQGPYPRSRQFGHDPALRAHRWDRDSAKPSGRSAEGKPVRSSTGLGDGRGSPSAMPSPKEADSSPSATERFTPSLENRPLTASPLLASPVASQRPESFTLPPTKKRAWRAASPRRRH